ncbi:MAG: ABC transporter ATP-binding protein/permease [Clostridiales bacterium]|nr:ABC transporter ATP-binding protein/permease [Clostridiales bacterium]
MKRKNALLRAIREHPSQWPGFIVIALLSLLAGVFKTQSAAAWGRAVDFGIGGQLPAVYSSLFVMLLFVLFDAARTSVIYRIIGHTTEGLFLSLRAKAYNALLHGDVAVLREKARSGDMAVRINSDAEQLCNLISGRFPEIIRRNFMAVMAIIYGLFLSWELLVIYAVLLPVSIWAVNRISKPIREQSKRSADSVGNATALASEVLSGLPTVKSFQLQGEMDGKYRKLNLITYKENLKTAKISARMSIIKQISSVAQLMLLFLVGALLVRAGRTTTGNILAFAAMSDYIRDAFSQIDSHLRVIRSSMALADRLYEVLDLPMEKEGAVRYLPPASETMLSFDKVSFSYQDTKALDGVSIRLKAGQKIGIIGPSGCGKSTLIKLICGFYQPSEGTVRVFGKDLRELAQDALRKNIAMISQDANLFDGTVFENVHYGNLSASDEAVYKAISQAALDISGLPQTADTPVGQRGTALSGGQKQRVAIGRALLKRAPLLILDEATSALDSKTEAEIQATLDELLQDQSAIIVAHRLTAVRKVDYLYCMEAGRVIEEGTPQQLLEQKGYYYSMRQKQGFMREVGVHA